MQLRALHVSFDRLGRRWLHSRYWYQWRRWWLSLSLDSIQILPAIKQWYTYLIFHQNKDFFISDGSVMKTYKPDTDNPSLFACEPGMDTKKDFWSPKCGWGCGQGRDSKLLYKSTRHPHCTLHTQWWVSERLEWWDLEWLLIRSRPRTMTSRKCTFILLF